MILHDALLVLLFVVILPLIDIRFAFGHQRVDQAREFVCRGTRVTGSWGCAMQRKITGQRRKTIRLLIPRQNLSFLFTADDRPDTVVRWCGAPPRIRLLSISAAPTPIADCPLPIGPGRASIP